MLLRTFPCLRRAGGWDLAARRAFSLRWLPLLQSSGSVALRLQVVVATASRVWLSSCAHKPEDCGIFPDRGLNLSPLAGRFLPTGPREKALHSFTWTLLINQLHGRLCFLLWLVVFAGTISFQAAREGLGGLEAGVRGPGYPVLARLSNLRLLFCYVGMIYLPETGCIL